LHLGDEELQAALAGSAMSRARAAGLRRNVEIANHNARTPTSWKRSEASESREPRNPGERREP
jgi:hypothetical protein